MTLPSIPFLSLFVPDLDQAAENYAYVFGLEPQAPEPNLHSLGIFNPSFRTLTTVMSLQTHWSVKKTTLHCSFQKSTYLQGFL